MLITDAVLSLYHVPYVVCLSWQLSWLTSCMTCRWSTCTDVMSASDRPVLAVSCQLWNSEQRREYSMCCVVTTSYCLLLQVQYTDGQYLPAELIVDEFLVVYCVKVISWDNVVAFSLLSVVFSFNDEPFVPAAATSDSWCLVFDVVGCL